LRWLPGLGLFKAQCSMLGTSLQRPTLGAEDWDAVQHDAVHGRVGAAVSGGVHAGCGEVRAGGPQVHGSAVLRACSARCHASPAAECAARRPAAAAPATHRQARRSGNGTCVGEGGVRRPLLEPGTRSGPQHMRAAHNDAQGLYGAARTCRSCRHGRSRCQRSASR
jgi:hypothetical protein